MVRAILGDGRFLSRFHWGKKGELFPWHPKVIEKDVRTPFLAPGMLRAHLVVHLYNVEILYNVEMKVRLRILY